MFHAVKTAYAANGRWVMNRATLGSVRKLKDTNGRYLWDPGLGLGQAPPTILGAPYTEMPDMPNEGSGTFPIAFGDWKRGYKLVDRVEMTIVRDPYTIANAGQVKFFARRRVGGQVILGEALRLLKCST
jgi:HK97 family phage major capsid protein